MIVIAFANAALRESVIIKRYPDIRAQQLSTLTLIMLITVYVWFIFPLLKIDSSKEALLTGFVWVILTILFEFILGRILKRSWTSLFEQLTSYQAGSGRFSCCGCSACHTGSIYSWNKREQWKSVLFVH
ncbi:hypothetical protein GZH53_09055 [Flavihumibacter sp. R14]|nr:hypothetical protein [Flavihumibacter soli]